MVEVDGAVEGHEAHRDDRVVAHRDQIVQTGADRLARGLQHPRRHRLVRHVYLAPARHRYPAETGTSGTSADARSTRGPPRTPPAPCTAPAARRDPRACRSYPGGCSTRRGLDIAALRLAYRRSGGRRSCSASDARRP